MELKGQWVHFRIRDVYIPEPQKLVMDLHGNDLLRGKAIDVSDNGTRKRTFVVVEVEGSKESVIVPVDRILRLSTT